MASMLEHCFLTSLVSLLLCVISALAAPALCSEPPPTDCSRTDCSQCVTDERWRLNIGLYTTATIIRRNESNANPPHSFNVSITTETLLGHLCDVLAYYDMAVKVDNSSDLQALLEQNALDAYSWLRYLNWPVTSTNALDEGSSSPPSVDNQLQNLRKYCLQRRLWSHSESPVIKSNELAEELYNHLQCSRRCDWVKNSTLAESYKCSIGNNFNCNLCSE